MSLERLKQALVGLQNNYSFKNEHDLVRAGAEAHDVTLSRGGMFDPLEMTDDNTGAYNARLVDKEEDLDKLAEALKDIDSLTIICEDYRQSAQVVNELGINTGDGKHAVLATAGGPTQPMEGADAGRHEALVEFITAFHEINPTAIIRLIAHDGVCGGHANYVGTAKEAFLAKKDTNLVEAVRDEDAIMIAHVRELAGQLDENQVDGEVLKGGLAKVDAENQYQGIEWFELSSEN